MLMKKITLFLASAILSLGAMAQTVVYELKGQLASGDLNAKTTSTMIAIKNLSATNNAYFVGNTGAAPYSKAWNYEAETVFVWEPVEEGVAGSYYLKKLDGTYMQTTAPKDFGAKETAAVFTTTNPTSQGSDAANFNGDGDSRAYINGNDDANLVRFVTNGKWINVQNGESGTPVYNTGKGGWTIHYVYAVETREAAMYEVTYSFMYDGVEKATQTTTAFGGAEYPDYDLSLLPYGVVPAAKPTEMVDKDCTVEVALSVELPFEVAADAEDITTWYYVKYHSNTLNYIEALDDNKIEWADQKAAAEASVETHLWGFVGDPWGLKVVSKTGKAIVSTSGDALLGDIANATAFVVVAPKSGAGVCLKYPDNNTYLNGQSGYLKSYGQNDEGSAFVVEAYVAPEPEEPTPGEGEGEGEPTGVERVEAQQSTVIYDLTGRRVNNLAKGIYIVNGKKVVIK